MRTDTLAPAATILSVTVAPTCHGCGRGNGLRDVTLCTGPIIRSCRWCEAERVLPIAAPAAPVEQIDGALFDLDGALF